MEDFGFAKRREKGDQGWEMDVHDKVDNDDVSEVSVSDAVVEVVDDIEDTADDRDGVVQNL